MVAASTAKTYQKKLKDRYTTNIFVEKQWHNEAELIIKDNESAFLNMKFYHSEKLENQVGKT